MSKLTGFDCRFSRRIICKRRRFGDDDSSRKTDYDDRNSFWTDERLWRLSIEKLQDQDGKHKDNYDNNYIEYDDQDIYIIADVYVFVNHICVDHYVCYDNNRHMLIFQY